MTTFSVLMSVYRNDRADWLDQALSSVFAQTILPSEFVLIEDGPIGDDLHRVIDKFSNQYPIFDIIVNTENIGLGLSLRKGVEQCRNEIIARMDSDDLMPHDRFEKQLRAIEQGYDIVSCWSQLFTDDDINNIIAIKHRPEHHDEIARLAHRRSPVCHAACMYRRSAVLRAGNYMDVLLMEDYHLWARMIMSGAKFYNVQEVLYYVRTNEEQAARRGGISYLRKELSMFGEFRRMGFYSRKDYLYNGTIRMLTRPIPVGIRKRVLRYIWNH